MDVDTGMEHTTPEDSARISFEVLMQILLKGMRVKYGDNTDPRRLSESQINTLKEYMRSFGWDFKVLSIEDESTYHRSKFTPKDIDWYRLRLPDPEMGVNHDIIFTSYKNVDLIPRQQGPL